MRQCIKLFVFFILFFSSPLKAFDEDDKYLFPKQMEQVDGNAESFFKEVEESPPGTLTCVQKLADIAVLMAYKEEFFIFQGVSLNEIIYFFFVGKGTYSIFFLHPVRGGYCTSKSLMGDVVGKLGKET